MVASRRVSHGRGSARALSLPPLSLRPPATALHLSHPSRLARPSQDNFDYWQDGDNGEDRNDDLWADGPSTVYTDEAQGEGQAIEQGAAPDSSQFEQQQKSDADATGSTGAPHHVDQSLPPGGGRDTRHDQYDDRRRHDDRERDYYDDRRGPPPPRYDDRRGPPPGYGPPPGGGYGMRGPPPPDYGMPPPRGGGPPRGPGMSGPPPPPTTDGEPSNQWIFDKLVEREKVRAMRYANPHAHTHTCLPPFSLSRPLLMPLICPVLLFLPPCAGARASRLWHGGQDPIRAARARHRDLGVQGRAHVALQGWALRAEAKPRRQVLVSTGQAR